MGPAGLSAIIATTCAVASDFLTAGIVVSWHEQRKNKIHKQFKPDPFKELLVPKGEYAKLFKK